MCVCVEVGLWSILGTTPTLQHSILGIIVGFLYMYVYICIYVPLFFVNLIQLLQNGSSTQGLYIHKR